MKLAFVIDNLGPYHVARLTAIAALAELLVIEVRQTSREYSWDPPDSVPFERITLLKSNEEHPWRAIRAALDSAAPDVVFTSGWSRAADLCSLLWAGRRRIADSLTNSGVPAQIAPQPLTQLPPRPLLLHRVLEARKGGLLRHRKGSSRDP
jgi:hypothetical protein